MAKTKEIRNKIASIKKTQKITKAMQMVAASKMRRAELRMRASQPYYDKICNVIAHVAAAHSEHRHRYLTKREQVKRVGLIVVATDRGLCGGLNINLFKMVVQYLQKWRGESIGVDLCLIGQKAVSFFKSLDVNIVATAAHLGDAPQLHDLVGAVKVILDEYDRGEIDRLFIVHNEFVNTMQQKPRFIQLLPLQVAIEERPKNEEEAKRNWDYIYEPNTVEILNTLLIRYLEMQIYQAVVDNIACEQAARMVAMQSASDNASEIIEEFQLMFNKARQAAITQEIAEIVGGAAAV